MIAVGTRAPDFTLSSHFGSPFKLGQFRGRSNVLLLFYPLDWTPICSGEIPEMEQLADRFAHDAHTQVAAISVDSRFSHAAWAASCVGVSYPILADFAPRGAVAQRYGAWIPSEQIADRATVIVDKDGVVRYAASVGKEGRRDMTALLTAATQIDRAQRGTQVPYVLAPRARGELFVKRTCPHCKAAVAAVTNGHAEGDIAIRYADIDPVARAAMGAVNSVPLLRVDGREYIGAPNVMAYLAPRYERMPHE